MGAGSGLEKGAHAARHAAQKGGQQGQKDQCPLPEEPMGEVGLDLAATRAIVSFGAPILDGWAAPGWVGPFSLPWQNETPNRLPFRPADRWSFPGPGKRAQGKAVVSVSSGKV